MRHYDNYSETVDINWHYPGQINFNVLLILKGFVWLCRLMVNRLLCMGKLYFSHSLALPSISHSTWWSRARAQTCKMDMVRRDPGVWDLSLSIGLEHSRGFHGGLEKVS